METYPESCGALRRHRRVFIVSDVVRFSFFFTIFFFFFFFAFVQIYRFIKGFMRLLLRFQDGQAVELPCAGPRTRILLRRAYYAPRVRSRVARRRSYSAPIVDIFSFVRSSLVVREPRRSIRDTLARYSPRTRTGGSWKNARGLFETRAKTLLRHRRVFRVIRTEENRGAASPHANNYYHFVTCLQCLLRTFVRSNSRGTRYRGMTTNRPR